MKPALKIGSHLALALAAFLAVYVPFGGGKDGAAQASRSRSPGHQAAEGQGKSRTGGAGTGASRMKSAEYKAAWDSIPNMKWTRTQRYEYQLRLLADWAETDLEGALAAALAESWRDGAMRPGGESFPFRRAFADVFVDRAEDVWKIIQSRSPGVLESSVLLDAWATTMLSKDPLAFLGYFREMNEADTLKSLEPVFRGPKDKDYLSKMLDILSGKMAGGFDPGSLDSPFFSEVGKVFSKEELLARISGSDGVATPFHVALLAGAFVESTRGGPAGKKVADEIQSLPSEVRGPVAKALLTANTEDGRIMQAALDSLVASGDWSLFDDKETSRAMRKVQQSADPVDLAEWSLALPPRPETAEMFHRGVEPYMRSNPAGAWDWIQQMDDGYWKDRALAEYSQTNLYLFNDPEKSAAALGQIQDPGFRGKAEGWRRDWEKQRGR